MTTDLIMKYPVGSTTYVYPLGQAEVVEYREHDVVVSAIGHPVMRGQMFKFALSLFEKAISLGSEVIAVENEIRDGAKNVRE